MDPILKGLVIIGFSCVAEVVTAHYLMKRLAPNTYYFWLIMAIIFVNFAAMYWLVMRG